MNTEQAVIGCILSDRDAARIALEALSPEDFADQAHMEIFRAAQRLAAAHMSVDLVSLSTALTNTGLFDLCGGMVYLVECSQAVPTAANVDTYVQIVQQDSARRRLFAGLRDVLVQGNERTPEEITADVLMLVQSVEGQRDADNDSLPYIVRDEYIAMQDRNDGKNRPLKTGFTDLDRITGGLSPGEMWVIGARPSVGKSAISMQIAENVVNDGKRAVFFSAEMSRAMVAQRYFAENGLSAQRVRSGDLYEDDWEAAYEIVKYSQRLENLHIDTTRNSVRQIRSRVRSLQAHGGIDLVIVDYLQIIQTDGRQETRNLEVASISADLKRLAKDLNVPVLVLSQLSRNSENRTGLDARPRLSDLRDSGGTEQDADVVALMYRLDAQASQQYGPLQEWLAESGNTLVRIDIAKNRNGPLNSVDLVFEGTRMRFSPPVLPASEMEKSEVNKP